MLVTLSSEGETDHAKFTNYFNDSVIIQPNSYVCFISGSIVENLSNSSIEVAAGTTMTVRFDPYNIVQKVITAVKRDYLVTEFVDLLNSLFGGKLYLGLRFKAVYQLNPNNQLEGQVLCQMYRVNNEDDNEIFGTWGYPGNTGNPNYLRQQNINYICPPSTALVAGYSVGTNVKGERDNWLYIDFLSSAAGISCVSTPSGNVTTTIAGTQATGLTNIDNIESFNMALWQPYLNQTADNQTYNITNMQFTIGATPSKTIGDTASFNFAIGTANYDAASNNFIDICVPGYDSHDSRSLQLTWTENNVSLEILNIETDEYDVLHNEEYKLGDMYKVKLNRVGTFTDPSYSYIPEVVRYDYGGLVYWIPGSVKWDVGTGSTDSIWNTALIRPCPGIDFLYKLAVPGYTTESAIINDWESNNVDFKANCGIMGCWGSVGFNRETYTNQANVPSYKDNGDNMVIQRDSFGTGTELAKWVKDCPKFQRTAVGDPVSASAEQRNRLDLNYTLATNNTTAISCLFRVFDDSITVSPPSTNLMTLIGGVNQNNITQGSVIAINLLQTEAYDIIVYDYSGNASLLTLTDTLGARIMLNYDTWYHMFYQDDGNPTGNQRNFDIQLHDIAANVSYSSGNQLYAAPGALRQPQVLGAAQTGGGAASAVNYFSGYIMQYRHYQLPRKVGQTTAIWNILKTELNDTYSLVGNYDSAYGKPTTEIMYGGTEKKYASVSDTNIENTVTPVFYALERKDVNVVNHFSFTDIWFPNNLKISNTDRYRAGAEDEYNSYGVGLVNMTDIIKILSFDDYDPDDDRLIEIYNPSNLLGPDYPFFNEAGNVAAFDLEDEAYNVEIRNLPHRSLNGVNHSWDKTIYQLPLETKSKIISNLKITEHESPQKIWISLQNPCPIPISSLDIQISQTDGQKADNLLADTHLVIQIEQKNDII